MILIPDIHINAKYWEKILAKLEEIFANHSDKEVIFLGDYVYMFSFDRSYLLKLFALFVDLYKQGRTVKVIAGNHDWIQGHFVFEEGKQAFDIIWNHIQGSWSLQFVTQPLHWEKDNVLHIIIPYNDTLQEPPLSSVYDPECGRQGEYPELTAQIKTLRSSSKTAEQLSWLLNQIILTYYQTNKWHYEEIVLYHHYYIAGVQFPSIQSIFTFQNVAIHHSFLDLPKLKLISWHLHEPFSYANYLCCGSLWHVSSLERNVCKYFMTGEPTTWFEAHMIHINPRMVIDVDEWLIDDKILNDQKIATHIDNVLDRSIQSIQWPMIISSTSAVVPLSLVDLVITTKHNPKSIQLDDKLIHKLHTYHIQMSTDAISSEHFAATIKSDYLTSFSDRKQLLDEYLRFKYPHQQSTLVDFMHKYNIL